MIVSCMHVCKVSIFQFSLKVYQLRINHNIYTKTSIIKQTIISTLLASILAQLFAILCCIDCTCDCSIVLDAWFVGSIPAKKLKQFLDILAEQDPNIYNISTQFINLIISKIKYLDFYLLNTVSIINIAWFNQKIQHIRNNIQLFDMISVA